MSFMAEAWEKEGEGVYVSAILLLYHRYGLPWENFIFS